MTHIEALSAQSRYLNQCCNIVNCTLGNKLRWNFNGNSNISIHKNAFGNVVCEIVVFFVSASMCFKSRNMPYLQCLGTDFYMLSIISYISTGAKSTPSLPSNKDSSWAVTVQCHRLICCFVNWLLINHRHLTLLASFDWPFYTQWSEGQRCRGRIYETINHVSCMDLLSHCQHQIHYPNTHDTCNLPRQRYTIYFHATFWHQFASRVKNIMDTLSAVLALSAWLAFCEVNPPERCTPLTKGQQRGLWCFLWC